MKRIHNLAITEHEKNLLALDATERFIKSGAMIRDVYGKLDR